MPQKHKLRDARGDTTQKQLSWIADVSPSTISHIECHRGPDVPADQRRPTKTKLSTAVKLVTALNQLGPGNYTVVQFVAGQQLFTELEIYEAIVNQQEREKRRQLRKQRRLMIAG